MNTRTVLMVPAHLSSKRFPQKILAIINGIPLLKRPLIQCSQAASKDDIYVVTPDREVYDIVINWGYKCFMSTLEARNGTSAIASIIDNVDADYIVNIQADELLVPAKLISELIDILKNNSDYAVTPVYRIKNAKEMKDNNVVKVVRDFHGNALYFSRSPIPYVRDLKFENWSNKIPYWAHFGIYGYKRKILLSFNKLQHSYLESAEKLEQLQLLQNGLKIFTFETKFYGIHIESPSDIRRVEEYLNRDESDNSY